MKEIFKVKFGSHLYGTSTPQSDTDYKGVFVESLENIVLKKDRDTYHKDTKLSTSYKNQSSDTDYECDLFVMASSNGIFFAKNVKFAAESDPNSTYWSWPERV